MIQPFEISIEFPATIVYRGRGVDVEVECLDLESEGGWRMRMGLRLSDMRQVSSVNGKTARSKVPLELAVKIFEDISLDSTVRGNEIVLVKEDS